MAYHVIHNLSFELTNPNNTYYTFITHYFIVHVLVNTYDNIN